MSDPSDDQQQSMPSPQEKTVYGCRLRFRASKGFTTESSVLSFSIDGHVVRLSSPDEKPLNQGGWFSLKATDFNTFAEAEEFGKRLQTALQVVSLRRVFGVDVGEGRVTASVSQVITDAWAEQGKFVRPNVHGLDVYEDKPGIAWFNMSVAGSISTKADVFFADLEDFALKCEVYEPGKFDTVRLLNEALISPEAAAQLVLAIAAVEMLAKGDSWSAAQKEVIVGLASAAQKDTTLGDEERQEVVDAVKRIYRIGVMESFRRLLKSLSLEDIWPQWRDLYNDRSAILHGLAYVAPAKRSELVMPALLIASKIVLTALEKEVPGAASGLDAVMPQPSSTPS